MGFFVIIIVHMSIYQVLLHTACLFFHFKTRKGLSFVHPVWPPCLLTCVLMHALSNGYACACLALRLQHNYHLPVCSVGSRALAVTLHPVKLTVVWDDSRSGPGLPAVNTALTNCSSFGPIIQRVSSRVGRLSVHVCVQFKLYVSSLLCGDTSIIS